jgi:hypothetical protein
LIVSAGSDNSDVVPDDDYHIIVDSDGANRSLTITPVGEGSATITINVSDGSAETNTSFGLEVGPEDDTIPSPNPNPEPDSEDDQEDSQDGTGNTAPRIYPVSIGNQEATASIPLTVNFRVEDEDTAISELTFTITSSDQDIVLNGNIELVNSGPECAIIILPQPNIEGIATITIHVSDGRENAETCFELEVTSTSYPDTPDGPTSDENSGNFTPRIYPVSISNQKTTVGIPLTVNFRVEDEDTAISKLTFTTTSSDQNIVPNENIEFVNSGPECAITILPEQNIEGVATITININDGSTNAGTSFQLEITPPIENF